MNADSNPNQPFAQAGYDLIGAALEVFREMGSGLTEEIYQESLEKELSGRAIPYDSQPEIAIYYKGILLRKRLRPDLVVLSEIVVELKAVSHLVPEHEAQVLNYLKVSRKSVGYLINFGSSPKLEWRRYANTRPRP